MWGAGDEGIDRSGSAAAGVGWVGLAILQNQIASYHHASSTFFLTFVIWAFF